STVGLVAGRRAGATAALAGIVAYSAVSGGTPSVLRAGVMAAIALLGMLVGRQRESASLLAAAVAALVLLRPVLVEDVGFQLSVAATAGLIVLAGPLERLFERLPAISSRPATPFRATAAATLAASVVTAPIAITTFGTLSLVSLPANVVAAPLVPAAMLSASVCGVAGLLNPDLGRALAAPAWLFTSALAALVELFAAVPSGSLRVAQPPGVVVVALYAVAGLVLMAVRRTGGLSWQSERGTWALLALSVAGATGMWAAVAATGTAETTVTFVDGGALVRTPGWRVVVVDGGGPTGLFTAELDRLLPVWDRRVHLYVATEWTSARAGALAEIARRVPVERVAGPALAGADPRWSALLADRRIAFTPVDRGTGFDLGDGAGVWIEPDTPLAVRLAVPHGPIALSDTGRLRGSSLGLVASSLGEVGVVGARYPLARHGAVRLVLGDDLRVYVEHP
ncbi:MAG: ComEC/Rec2 family competence protein, partial [Thermomicrobiales bacterium]|nr:ComEC/Rec2 family competence protein [Thermomicrobiales bacterium]